MVLDVFFVHPYLGKIPISTNIFQMVSNHQLVLSPGFRIYFFVLVAVWGWIFCRNDRKLPFTGQVRVINPTSGEFSIIVVNNQTQLKPQQNSCVCHQQIMVTTDTKRGLTADYLFFQVFDGLAVRFAIPRWPIWLMNIRFLRMFQQLM